jgi:5'-nucleotidase
MAEGYDGFAPLKDRKMIIDDETGQRMSNIIRSFLLGELHLRAGLTKPGSQYIYRHKQLLDHHQAHLSQHTAKVLARENRRTSYTPSPKMSPAASPKSPLKEFRQAVASVMRSPLSSPIVEKDEGSADGVDAPAQKRHVVRHDWSAIRDALHVARHEHLSAIDCFVSPRHCQFD